MSTQHTPEPWKIVEHNWEHTGIYPESGHRIAVCEINPEVDENTQERYEAINDANARRIVACVNACAGIPTEVLENIGAGMGPNWLQAKQERDALKIENDEMRRLLMRALYHHQGGSSPIGQPIRRFFGIGQFDELTAEQKEPSRVAAQAHLLDVYGKPCSEWPACGCPRYCSIPF